MKILKMTVLGLALSMTGLAQAASCSVQIQLDSAWAAYNPPAGDTVIARVLDAKTNHIVQSKQYDSITFPQSPTAPVSVGSIDLLACDASYRIQVSVSETPEATLSSGETALGAYGNYNSISACGTVWSSTPVLNILADPSSNSQNGPMIYNFTIPATICPSE